MSPRLNECFASQNGPSAMIERGSSTVRSDRKKIRKKPTQSASLRFVVFSVRFLLWALGTIQRQGGKACSEEAVFYLSRARKNPDSCGILWTNTWWSDFYLELMFVCCLRFSPGRTRYFFKCLDTTRTMRILLSAMKQQLKLNLLERRFGWGYPTRHLWL